MRYLTSHYFIIITFTFYMKSNQLSIYKKDKNKSYEIFSFEFLILLSKSKYYNIREFAYTQYYICFTNLYT